MTEMMMPTTQFESQHELRWDASAVELLNVFNRKLQQVVKSLARQRVRQSRRDVVTVEDIRSSLAEVTQKIDELLETVDAQQEAPRSDR